MEIHFVSSLVPEDERRLAPAILSALEAVFADMPIAYNLRATSDTGTVLERTHVPGGDVRPPTVRRESTTCLGRHDGTLRLASASV